VGGPGRDRVGRVRDRGVVPVAAAQLVGPWAADEDVVARGAAQRLAAGAPDEDVVAVATVGREEDRGRGEAARQDDVVAGPCEHGQPVAVRLGMLDPHERGEPEHGGRSVLALDDDHVVAVRAVDRDRVGRAVAGATADRRGEVGDDLGQIRAAHVRDHDVVGSAEGLEEDLLGVVEVHRDARDVAEEADPLAVRRDVDVLGRARPVEEQRVEPVLALDDVAPVTRIPAEDIVGSTEESDVVALVAVDEVVLRATQQDVAAAAAEDGVLPGPAFEGQCDRGRLQRRRRHGVVAAEGVDNQRVVRLHVADRGRVRQAGDRRGARCAGDLDRVGCAGCLQTHGVDLAVPGVASERPFEVDVQLDEVGPGEALRLDRVRAAERLEGDLLDVIEVHRDAGDVAEEANALAVRRDVDVLGDAGAVERHRVRAALALDAVAAVAGIPAEDIVGGPQEGRVVAPVPVDEVVVRSALQRLGATAAVDRVLVVLTVQRGRPADGEDTVRLVDPKHVGAGPGLDEDLVDPRKPEALEHLGVDDDLEPSRIPGLEPELDRFGSVAAGHLEDASLHLGLHFLLDLDLCRGRAGRSAGPRYEREAHDRDRSDEEQPRHREAAAPYWLTSLLLHLSVPFARCRSVCSA
jgi:hypothetical protein